MLEYIALGILLFAGVTVFYGIIVIHDIPYEIAVHRNHPHQDAIHYAGWVSLFTLHAIWPFLWIWSTLYREDRGWGFEQNQSASRPDATQSATSSGETDNAGAPESDMADPVALLQQKLDALDDRIERIEQAILAVNEADNSDEGAG
jgi:hypothetical protein